MKKSILFLSFFLVFLFQALANVTYIGCTSDGTAYILVMDDNGNYVSITQVGGCPYGNAWIERINCVAMQDPLPLSEYATNKLNGADFGSTVTEVTDVSQEAVEFLNAMGSDNVPNVYVLISSLNEAAVGFLQENGIIE